MLDFGFAAECAALALAPRGARTEDVDAGSFGDRTGIKKPDKRRKTPCQLRGGYRIISK
jgi:hypothetical protein